MIYNYTLFSTYFLPCFLVIYLLQYIQKICNLAQQLSRENVEKIYILKFPDNRIYPPHFSGRKNLFLSFYFVFFISFLFFYKRRKIKSRIQHFVHDRKKRYPFSQLEVYIYRLKDDLFAFCQGISIDFCPSCFTGCPKQKPRVRIKSNCLKYIVGKNYIKRCVQLRMQTSKTRTNM